MKERSLSKEYVTFKFNNMSLKVWIKDLNEKDLIFGDEALYKSPLSVLKKFYERSSKDGNLFEQRVLSECLDCNLSLVFNRLGSKFLNRFEACYLGNPVITFNVSQGFALNLYYNKLSFNKGVRKLSHLSALVRTICTTFDRESNQVKEGISLEFIHASVDYFCNAKYKVRKGIYIRVSRDSGLILNYGNYSLLKRHGTKKRKVTQDITFK